MLYFKASLSFKNAFSFYIFSFRNRNLPSPWICFPKSPTASPAFFVCCIPVASPRFLQFPQDQPILPCESHYISITNAVSVISQTMFYSRQSIQNESRYWFDLTWRMNCQRSNANCCEIWETYTYIHIKYIPVDLWRFLNASQTLRFRVIRMVERIGFQKLRKKLDFINRTAP